MSVLRISVLGTLGALALLASPVHAGTDFSTGVSDDRVSLPEGPGSLEGIGDNVSVDANMGLMHHSVPIVVPEGFPGVTPSLALSYSSGGGNSLCGVGWSLELPTLERMTSFGLPEYDEADLFAANGSEQLVRISPLTIPANQPALYRSRFEKGFVRYLWHGRGRAGYWEAQFPDGRRGYFGATKDGSLVTAARVVGSDPQGTAGTFRYHLVELVDAHGHSMRIDYQKSRGAARPVEIRYLFDAAGQAHHSVKLSYETRTDLLSDASSGTEVVLDERLVSLKVFSGTQVLREVRLGYDAYTASGGLSRLAKVETYGATGGLYPIVHAFGYTQPLGVDCHSPSCGQPQLVPMGTLGVSLGKASLVDLNGDALPDVLDSSDRTGQPMRVFFSRLQANGTTTFTAPASLGKIRQATGTDFPLEQRNVQLLDLNGDGFTDLLNARTGQALVNRGDSDFTGLLDLSKSGFPDPTQVEVRFFDYDQDKRIDLIQSDATGTFVYRNQGNDTFVRLPVKTLGVPLTTGGPNAQFTDMNGDGLLDVVYAPSGQAVLKYRLNLGWGQWSGETPSDWTDVTLPINPDDPTAITAVDMDTAMFEDLNGDALSDLIVVKGQTVAYSLNRNGATFDPPRTVRGLSLPERVAGMAVLAADMNGNGSTDIVWISQTGEATYLELFPLRPHLLTRIENGLSKVTEIAYTTSLEHLFAAARAGAPWKYQIPFPMTLVDRLVEYDRLTPVESYDITHYRYRDGFYDGQEKQYRGYARVELEREGDSSQEAGLTIEDFDVGATDTYRNGLLLRSQISSGGKVLEEQTTTYQDCEVWDLDRAPVVAIGPYAVRHICATREERLIKEGAAEREWVTVLAETTTDGYGQVVADENHGVRAVGGKACAPCQASGVYGEACGTECLGDEHFTETLYVTPGKSTSGAWILGKAYQIRAGGKKDSALYTESRVFFDGEPFVGLPDGTLTRGLPTRVLSLMSEGQYVPSSRTRYNADGQVVETLDPNGTLEEKDTHRRVYDYDGIQVRQADLLLRTDDGTPYRLRREVTYDALFRKPVRATAWRRVAGSTISSANSTFYEYDEFGRMVRISRWDAEASGAKTTQTFAYELGTPIGQIATIAWNLDEQGREVREGESVQCLDGLGRVYQEREKTESGAYQVTGFHVRNRANETQRLYLSYVGTSPNCDLVPPTSLAFAQYRYDALSRPIEHTLTDAKIYGSASVLRYEYRPLSTITFDAEDGDPANPHAHTPTVQRINGLGRVIALARILKAGQDPIWQSLTFDELGRIRGTIEASGHEKIQTYDLLGRLLEVSDPNSGTIRYGHDDRGNVIVRTDSRGMVLRLAYDGMNRLIHQWDEAHAADTRVSLTYDHDNACGPPCTNAAGHIAAIRYPGGSELIGYDARGQRTYHSMTLEGFAYVTRWQHDNRGRITNVTYPDDRIVRYSYDAASRLVSVPGFVTHTKYEEHGLVAEMALANGLTLRRRYDDRQRPESMGVLGTRSEPLLDYHYVYERDDDLSEIRDTGPTHGTSLSGGGSFAYDAWHRVIEATLPNTVAPNEELRYRYDATDNITDATSSMGARSRAHRGAYEYDATRPNAVVRALEVSLSYDESGNVTTRNGVELAWDAFGRMVKSSRPTSDRLDETATYTYGAFGEHIGKNGPHGIVRYIGSDYEVRDGHGLLFVRTAQGRIAVEASPILATRVYSDVAPYNAPDKKITAGDAWLSLAHAQGLARLASVPTDPDRLLLSAARRLLLADTPTLFLHSDHLQSVVLTTDAAGIVAGRQSYYPFGLQRAAEGDTDVYGYAGQEMDTETGLVRFWFRNLDPVLGRWLSPDPLFEIATEATFARLGEATSAFAYVANNPVGHRDPTGLMMKTKGPRTPDEKTRRAIKQRVDAKIAVNKLKDGKPNHAFELALGLNDPNHHLQDFAIQTQSEYYFTIWNRNPTSMSQIRTEVRTAMDEAKGLHFNLEGMDLARTQKWMDRLPVSMKKANIGGNLTSWELYTVLADKSLLDKTTFYEGKNIVPAPKLAMPL
jgi:RHS repeat-associated protein